MYAATLPPRLLLSTYSWKISYTIVILTLQLSILVLYFSSTTFIQVETNVLHLKVNEESQFYGCDTPSQNLSMEEGIHSIIK